MYFVQKFFSETATAYLTFTTYLTKVLLNYILKTIFPKEISPIIIDIMHFYNVTHA